MLTNTISDTFLRVLKLVLVLLTSLSVALQVSYYINNPPQKIWCFSGLVINFFQDLGDAVVKKIKKNTKWAFLKINELPEMKENRIVNYLKFRGYYEPEIL